MTQTELTPFRFSVRTNEPANRKIVCEPPDGNLPTYIVDIDSVNRRAKAVRAALRRFVAQCMDLSAGGVSKSGAHLKELAQCGNDLYWAIFNDRANPANSREVREWVAAAAGSYRMNIVIDDRTYIPWGLVYDGELDRLSGEPEDVDIRNYEDFWCLKYLVSPFYRNIMVRAGVTPRPVSLYRLISALHRQAFTGAEACMDTSEPERQVLEWLRSHFDATQAFNAVYDKNTLFNSWGDHADLDMIFFYCHANETSIAFSTTEMLTMDDIDKFQQKQEQLKASPTRAGCLFFMNGCSTAVGDAGGGFLEVTGRRGASGFIGTETEIPDLFALRFGLAFLYYFLLEGRPVYEVMGQLRREHWPLSLLYSTYCSPGLRVEPPSDDARVSVTFSNFSHKRLGTTNTSVI
ncbi:MAG TPA: hypothetical protein VEY11_05690 [Pyrinomonadaceae bacterium]|nr:hypothetical protein [Pyrinomonadaceae bacterium]